MECTVGIWHKVKASGDIIVPVQGFIPEKNSTAIFLMLPALGVKARFYRHLAEGLAAGGIATYLLEQRGHGESPYRARRGADFGYADFLDVDIPAAIDFVKQQQPGLPLYLGGHSLGGHLASITAGRRSDEIAGIAHMACGFPHAGFYEGRQSTQVRFLARLIPLFCLLFGYYPGEKLGFGGREYKSLMMDWRRWALQGSYDFAGNVGLEETIADFDGRALSVAFDKDDFISEKALEYARTRLAGAQLKSVTLTETQQGRYLGHFDWAKAPNGAVHTLLDWLR